MSQDRKIDFDRLVGFANMNGGITDKVDFQDETLGARLGAKVGVEGGWCPPKLAATRAVQLRDDDHGED